MDGRPSEAFPNRYTIFRPIVPLNLIHAGLTWSCYAIVDSGADDCIFPASFASRIGIDLKQGKRYTFTGAEGGSQEARFFDIDVTIPASRPIRSPT